MAVAAVPDDNQPDRIDININDLTLGDLEDIESVIGPEQMRLVMRGEVGPKAMVALVWVAKRADQPGFSLDDARKLPLSMFNVEDGQTPKDVES